MNYHTQEEKSDRTFEKLWWEQMYSRPECIKYFVATNQLNKQRVGANQGQEKNRWDQIQMFWKIAHFLVNRWDQFHMFLWDQIHINRVGPGTFLRPIVISKKFQILDRQPRILKVFLDHMNNFFSQQVTTILVTKYQL